MVLLNKEELKKLILKKGLIEGYINLEIQLTPNGFDLTVEKVFNFKKGGTLDFSNKERVIPEAKEILPKRKNPQDKFGWWNLKRGVYKIRTNEIINLPLNLVALAFSRTSLLRMGAFSQHGVWDAGFSGKGEFILVVENPYGVSLKQNSRIAQIVFLKVNSTAGYQGIFKDLR